MSFSHDENGVEAAQKYYSEFHRLYEEQKKVLPPNFELLDEENKIRILRDIEWHNTQLKFNIKEALL